MFVQKMSSLRLISGGIGNFGVFDECLIGEELAFGCSGIATAAGATGLGVSCCHRSLLSKMMARANM